MAQDSHGVHEVHIQIDKAHYRSPNPTTGSALYLVAKVPAGFLLFEKVEGHADDPINNDDTVLHLRDGDHFHSVQSPSAETTIFVNTDPFKWEHPKIRYDQVVKLAFPTGSTGENVLYSVTWTKPDGQEGALQPFHHVKVVNGMMFDVRNTDKS